MDNKGFYPIRAVAKLVGMTTDSIRAWERRYGAVKPRRSRGGRLYSDEDVQRLMMLKQAVDQGHSIGQIASLDAAGLRSLPMEDAESAESSRVRKRYEERQINAILECLKDYNAPEADRLLGCQAALLPPREFVYTLVLPLMQYVGNAWVEGSMSIAQEHMLSSIMRNLLGTLLRINSRESSAKKLLFTSLPGERHEFGVLSAAMLTAGAGLRAVYLGPDMPIKETVGAQQKTGADTLVLSLVSSENKNQEHMGYLVELCELLDDEIDVVLGGFISSEVSAVAKNSGIKVMNSMEQFEAYLIGCGGSF